MSQTIRIRVVVNGRIVLPNPSKILLREI